MASIESAQELKDRLDRHVAATAKLHERLTKHAVSSGKAQQGKAIVDDHLKATKSFHRDALALMQPDVTGARNGTAAVMQPDKKHARGDEAVMQPDVTKNFGDDDALALMQPDVRKRG